MPASESSAPAPADSAVETELLDLVDTGRDRPEPATLRRVLANPHVTERVIRAILDQERALELHEVRRGIATHRSTPQAEALRMVSTLFWSDLLDLGRDVRVRPPIRRAAHRALVERYDALAVGERVAVARRAGIELLGRVRHDPEPRVISAMLDNPRLTEGLLLPLLVSGRTPSAVLALVVRSEKWSSRYEVRRMACRNPRTPTDVAMALLPALKRGDLRALSVDPSVPLPVRRRAGKLIGRDDDNC